jgi:hypothetical protein
MTIQVSNVTTTGNVVYTSSGNTVVTFLSICNYNIATPVTANIYIVPSGQSVSNSYVTVSNLAIANADTYQIYAGNEKLVLGNGDFIHVNCSANTVTAITSYTSA